ncbi:MAG: hypothetical protein ACRDQZ_13175 [Mycobacteriales bacterium]
MKTRTQQRAESRAAQRGSRIKRTSEQWHVDPTPTALEPPAEPSQLTDDDKKRATDAIRKGVPIKMGGTVTRYPDPGGVPNLSVQADDVSVRVGGMPIRNPTAASGNAVAPGASAIIADSGQLAAGTYLVEINLAASAVAAAGKQLQVEHRNAANAATVNVLGGTTGGQVASFIVERIVIALNERIRVVVGPVAFAATEGAVASIRAYRLDV